MDVGGWLRQLGLEEYRAAFAAHHIDREVLATLTAEDLRELGVVSLGHRKKLLAAITRLNETPEIEGPLPSAPGESVAERRQVTVLFADLAGYTRLAAELDAEEVHRLLERFFGRVDEVIVAYGGRVDKHIGDCAMAVFGAPVAHGNDPERAIRAALAIREAMAVLTTELGRRIAVHVGVAAGQVVASGIGSSSHREYTVTGETVNLASRLTDAAATDEILVSAAVPALLPDGFTFAPHRLHIEGVDREITAWRLLAVPSAPVRVHAGPLIGRQTELRQFESMLDACRSSGCGQTLYLRGEAGIGKTRLADEFRQRAEAAGFLVHTGIVLDFGTAAGQDPIRALVRDMLGLRLDAASSEVAAAASQALAGGLVAADRQVFLNDLLDLPQSTKLRALYDAMDSASRILGKQATLLDLVRHASRRQPRLLIIEDVHWADRIVLDYLADLCEAIADCPTILVVTSRIEGDPLDRAWRRTIGRSPLLTLDLGPLRPQEAEAFANAFTDASRTSARQCIERAAGNPLFLEQLLRFAGEIAGAGVPGSVQSLVQARMDRLVPADKAALQAASVFGQRFSLSALRHLIEAPDYTCTALIEHYLVRPQGGDLLFGHALIRDAVYDSMLRARRKALHSRVAGWFEQRDPVLHAKHLDRAEDPAAARAYLGTARGEVAAYHYESALRLVERGRQLAAAPSELFALTCLKGEILHDLGSMGEAQAAFTGALNAALSDAERSQARIGLATVQRVIDDLDGAFANLAEAEEEARRAMRSDQLARIHFLRGNLYFPRGDIDGCLAEHQRSLELAQAAGSAELEAAALGGLGDAEYVRGRMITGHQCFQRCVEVCREHGFGRIEVANASMLGHTALYFKPQAVAVEEALAAQAAAARVGHQRAELNAAVAVMFGRFAMADPQGIREMGDRCQALVHRLGARRFEQPRLLFLARAALFEGDRAAARTMLAEALSISRATGIGFHGANISGSLALVLDDPEEQRAALAEGEAMLTAGAVAHNHLRFYVDAIELALELRDFAEVARYTAALEAFTQPEPLPWASLFVARGRALAAYHQGRVDPALEPTLRALRTEAERLDLRIALSALQAALGD